MSNKVVLILLCLVMLCGCGTKNMVKQDYAPNFKAGEDEAILVILHETSFGAPFAFSYYLDGEPIGETGGLDYFVTKVTPGEHYVLTVDENTGVARFNFKAGKTYFLGIRVTIGVWTMRTAGYYPMSEEDVRTAMRNCSYMKFNLLEAKGNMDPKQYQQSIDEYLRDIKENPDGFKEILAYDGVFI